MKRYLENSIFSLKIQHIVCIETDLKKENENDQEDNEIKKINPFNAFYSIINHFGPKEGVSITLKTPKQIKLPLLKVNKTWNNKESKPKFYLPHEWK